MRSTYQRKVDKKQIPTCNIMGVNIAAESDPLSALLSVESDELPQAASESVIPAAISTAKIFLDFMIVSSLFRFIQSTL